jgi:3-polyprenyl-4-hydroxybenzoate decarboxylase
VAGAKKYKYNTKYNTNTYNTKYTPPSGVFSFPDRYVAGPSMVRSLALVTQSHMHTLVSRASPSHSHALMLMLSEKPCRHAMIAMLTPNAMRARGPAEKLEMRNQQQARGTGDRWSY